MGGCHCSKDLQLITSNISDILIPPNKPSPPLDSSTISQPSQKLYIDTKPPTIAQPSPSHKNSSIQNDFPIKTQKTMPSRSKIANDNFSNIDTSSITNPHKQANETQSALCSKSASKNIRRQFTDTCINLTIVDTNLFNEHINEINIVILGGIKVGKSAFVIRVKEHRFEKLYIPTIAVEITSKIIQYKERAIKINFIVTPGDKQYKEDYTLLYEKANFIFLCYDITNESSFIEAKQLLYEEVCEYAGLLKIGVTNFYFIGNKLDVPNRKDILTTVQAFCKKHKLDLFEISVKTGQGIKLLMNNVLGKYIDVMNDVS